MKPLSKKKRLGYVFFLIFVFFVITPIIIMYAKGFRLDSVFNIISTGGIHISATQSGTEIYIDDKLVRTTSIFQKSVFVQNLTPGVYNVRVRKDGYQVWVKTLQVFSETVTEARSFILPVNPIVTEIPQKIFKGSATTSTSASGTALKANDNPEYVVASTLFREPKKMPITVKIGTSTIIATSTNDYKEYRKLLVERVNGSLRITWRGVEDSKPAYFCQNEICKDEIFIKLKSKLNNFDFLPGRDDLIIMSVDSGIYVSEIDDRSPQNIQKLFDGPNADFRIRGDGSIFFKKDNKYYSIAL